MKDSTLIPEGKIDTDSKAANYLGFTSDKFFGYLWRTGNRLIISFIESKQEGKGNLRKLLSEIEAHGLEPVIPTPSGRMRAILHRLGFVETWEVDEDMGEACELMVKPCVCSETSSRNCPVHQA